jgi:hypothetical protein
VKTEWREATEKGEAVVMARAAVPHSGMAVYQDYE